MVHYTIHIGYAKTGSSALQAFLARNRRRLLDKGLLYPDTRVGIVWQKMVNHNAVAAAVAGRPNSFGISAEDYFRQFADQAADRSVTQVILSAEGFTGFPNVLLYGCEREFRSAEESYIYRLRDVTRPSTVRIIVYLRRQDRWLDSTANQRIKLEGMNTGPRFQTIEQFYELVKPRMDYLTSLCTWASAFGSHNIVVRAYERQKLYNHSVVDDFMRLIDTDYDPAGYDHQSAPSGSNPGLSRDVLEYKLRLNRVERTEHERRFLEVMLQEISMETKGSIYPLVHPQLSAALARYYQPINSEISRLFLNGDDALFSEEWPSSGKPLECYPGLSPEAEQAISTRLRRKSRSLRGVSLYLRLLFSSKLRRAVPWLHLVGRRLARACQPV